MRYRDILTEGMKDYLKMFQGFPQDMMQRVKHNVQAASQDLKRQDRIVWYLRYFRIISLWYQFQNQNLALTPEQIDKAKGRGAATVGAANFDDALVQANEVVKNYQSFKHYVDLNLPDIDKIVWDRQTPDELLEMMSKIEKKWQENLKSSIIHTGEEEMLLDCGNGWVWFNLNKYSCDKEAKAMGHCGNTGGSHGETILSLRREVSKGRWTPRVTFILDTHSGVLGEMKGRGNEKPERKYHPQIMALLRHDIIKGIKGGGYLPQNNFSMNDLDNHEAEQLKNEKPGLQQAIDLYDKWHKQKEAGEIDPKLNEIFQEKLEEELDKYGSYDSIDWDQEKIIIEKTRESAFFSYFAPLSNAEKLFEEDGLEELIVQFAPRIDDSEAHEIAKVATDEHYEHIVDFLLGLYARGYQLSDVDIKWDRKQNEIIEFISFRAFLYEDDDILSSVTNLNDTRDDDHYDSDDLKIDGDAVDDELMSYLAGNRKKQKDGRDLVQVVLNAYLDHDGNLRRTGVGRPAPDDRNQYKFDF